MQIPSNLTMGFFLSELIIGFFISSLVLLLGLSFIKSYVSRKEWDDSRGPVIIVSLIWIILNILVEFIFLYFIGAGGGLISAISDILRIVAGIGITTVVVL